MKDIERILTFWFRECSPEQWFRKDPVFDDAIRQRFGLLVEAALRGRLQGWCRDAQGCLAAVLLLDQFTRNIHRDTAKAFAGDPQARAIAANVLARGWDRNFGPEEKAFFYMPLQHSEELADQERSVALFGALDDAEKTDYAVRHRDIIARFGRFPHRNAALGRRSTEAELAFLKQPGSSF